VLYIASLIEITVLRGGIAWNSLFGAEHLPVQWIPFKTTLDELKSGAWPFIYHVGGNLAWFIPLGLIMRRKSVWTVLLAGILISAVIECLQWVFVTGMTDVDDVIFNTCGALIGYLLFR
jgi:glycopeptide antibiotics resistance protein